MAKEYLGKTGLTKLIELIKGNFTKVEGKITDSEQKLNGSINDAKAGDFDVTLTVAGWSNGTTQTVTDSKFVMNGVDYLIVSAPDNFTAYNLAGIHAQDMSEAGKMTFVCGEGQTPTVELKAHVMTIVMKEGE